jgi:glutathione S-transferase
MPTRPILHTSPGSHHARRVALLIHELGLDVEVRAMDVRPKGMGGANDTPEFLALNPYGKVPVLEDGDLVLTESNAIMAYLAERHGFGPLWPADLAERAQILKWQFLQGSHLSLAADGLLYENVMKPMMGREPDEAARASLIQSFHRCAAVLDEALSKSPYLVAGRVTCADLSVVTALMYARATQLPIDAHPPLAAWVARIQERPSWRATEPPPMRP